MRGWFLLVALASPIAAPATPVQARAPVEPAPAASALDILTFNTWGLPSPIASDRRGRFPLISRFVEESGVDVAGLQEVWRGALGLLSLDHLRVPAAGIDTGLVLVTPHPVERLSVHAYAAERGVDAWKSKGVLQARLDVPLTGEVEVFVTHMQAGGGDKNARVRAAQARELIARVEAVVAPVIVLGDFNLYAGNAVDERTWASLRAAGLMDAAVAIGEVGSTYLDLDQRFDRVYLRDGGDVSLRATDVHVVPYDDDPLTVAPPVLSDHQPVRVRADVLRRGHGVGNTDTDSVTSPVSSVNTSGRPQSRARAPNATSPSQ